MEWKSYSAMPKRTRGTEGAMRSYSLYQNVNRRGGEKLEKQLDKISESLNKQEMLLRG